MKRVIGKLIYEFDLTKRITKISSKEKEVKIIKIDKENYEKQNNQFNSVTSGDILFLTDIETAKIIEPQEWEFMH